MYPHDRRRCEWCTSPWFPSYFLFFALFLAAAGALLIHSYCIIQYCLFILIESISLSSLCIPCFLPNVFVLTCTYVYLLSIILTSGTLQRRPYSPEMMQLQHEYITTTATIISNTRAWANGTDDTAVPREIQQHGSKKSYRRRYRNWPWSHPVMLQGKCYLSSSSCTAIYS